jgi:hypothetical protein
MKNLQQTMDKNETVIFKQTMITGDDPRFCPVAAFNRQLNILDVDVTSEVPLFQSCPAFAGKFVGKVAKYSTYRGVAEWVSKVVGRNLTFRQCSRNVVFTKLANDQSTSDSDKAKFMGVCPKTIAVYHKTSDEKRFACSAVVCNVRVDDVKKKKSQLQPKLNLARQMPKWRPPQSPRKKVCLRQPQ